MFIQAGLWHLNWSVAKGRVGMPSPSLFYSPVVFEFLCFHVIYSVFKLLHNLLGQKGGIQI